MQECQCDEWHWRKKFAEWWRSLQKKDVWKYCFQLFCNGLNLFLRHLTKSLLDIFFFIIIDTGMLLRRIIYNKEPDNCNSSCDESWNIERINPTHGFRYNASQRPCSGVTQNLSFIICNPKIFTIFGTYITVPNVPPNKHEMNLPRSSGGDHFEMRQCNDGYKTPFEKKN